MQCLSGNGRKTCAGSNQIQSFVYVAKIKNVFFLCFILKDEEMGTKLCVWVVKTIGRGSNLFFSSTWGVIWRRQSLEKLVYEPLVLTVLFGAKGMCLFLTVLLPPSVVV